MEVTTMVCVILGILAATFLGVTMISQWAQVQKAKSAEATPLLSLLAHMKKEEEDENDR